MENVYSLINRMILKKKIVRRKARRQKYLAGNKMAQLSNACIPVTIIQAEISEYVTTKKIGEKCTLNHKKCC